MPTEVMLSVLNGIEEQVGQLFGLPVPLDQGVAVSIRTATNGQRYLRLVFPDVSPHDVRAIVQGVGEAEGSLADPPLSQVLMRVWLPAWFYLHAILDNDAPDAILYRGAAGALSGTDVTLTGTSIGQASTELEIAFLAEDTGGGWRFLDPAIVVRMMASFDDTWQELVVEAIRQQPQGSESFGFDRAVAYLDALPLASPRWRMFLDSIRQEYHARVSQGISTPTAIDALYRMLIPPPSGARVTRAEFLRDFPAAVQANAHRMAHYCVTDQDLHCVVFNAHEYEMDLIRTYDFGLGFMELEPLLGQYQIIVNGPTFDVETCGLPSSSATRAKRYVTAYAANAMGIDYRGLTKGRLVFRSGGTVDGDCPIANPSTWRFHFGQQLTGEYTLSPNLIPDTHSFACAFDNVTGVFLQGLRVGLGHEIETERAEPDDPYGIPEKHPIIDGLPILGRCEQEGAEYLFVIMRPDYPIVTWERPEMSDWEEMLLLLQDMGVIDAFITDGDDSIGLMVEGEGTVAIEPGGKKNGLIALAIGFRRI